MTRTLNPHISLRPVEHADVRWFELWDQDPHVIAATTDRPGATVAFEGTEWAEAMMRLACMLCFANRAVTAIVIDPLNSNTRAHAFYRRLGFVATHRQIFDGTDDCLVHRLTRARWARHFPDDLVRMQVAV